METSGWVRNFAISLADLSTNTMDSLHLKTHHMMVAGSTWRLQANIILLEIWAQSEQFTHGWDALGPWRDGSPLLWPPGAWPDLKKIPLKPKIA